MNVTLLRKHIQTYLSRFNKTPEKHHQELEERRERIVRYQKEWTRDKLLTLDALTASMNTLLRSGPCRAGITNVM